MLDVRSMSRRSSCRGPPQYCAALLLSSYFHSLLLLSILGEEYSPIFTNTVLLYEELMTCCGAVIHLEPTLQDVADADCVAVEMILSLKRMATVPPEYWDSTMEASLSDMTFCTEDTLGRSFELVEGGADIPVNSFNLATFIRLSERFRLLEGTEGVEAVLRGIAAVLPLGRIRLLFDWRYKLSLLELLLNKHLRRAE